MTFILSNSSYIFRPLQEKKSGNVLVTSTTRFRVSHIV